MSSDRLFAPPPADPDTLTGRQRQAYELLHAAGPDGVEPDQVGAATHAARGKHDPDDRCGWCGSDGLQLLHWLRDRGLAVKVRRGPWVTVDQAARRPTADRGYDPATADWPEGF